MRLVIAAAATVLVAMLLGWQIRREQLVKACVDAGGIWHGSRSICRQLPGRPLLQRDLQRS
jgi:hypothetical protein